MGRKVSHFHHTKIHLGRVHIRPQTPFTRSKSKSKWPANISTKAILQIYRCIKHCKSHESLLLVISRIWSLFHCNGRHSSRLCWAFEFVTCEYGRADYATSQGIFVGGRNLVLVNTIWQFFGTKHNRLCIHRMWPLHALYTRERTPLHPSWHLVHVWLTRL